MLKEGKENTKYFGTYQELLRKWEFELFSHKLSEYGSDGDGKRLLAKDLDISLATLYRKLSYLGLKDVDF